MLPASPREADESKDTWQVLEAGSGSLSLPPGLLARRTDLGVAAPRPIPGGFRWPN